MVPTLLQAARMSANAEVLKVAELVRPHCSNGVMPTRRYLVEHPDDLAHLWWEMTRVGISRVAAALDVRRPKEPRSDVAKRDKHNEARQLLERFGELPSWKQARAIGARRIREWIADQPGGVDAYARRHGVKARPAGRPLYWSEPTLAWFLRSQAPFGVLPPIAVLKLDPSWHAVQEAIERYYVGGVSAAAQAHGLAMTERGFTPERVRQEINANASEWAAATTPELRMVFFAQESRRWASGRQSGRAVVDALVARLLSSDEESHWLRTGASEVVVALVRDYERAHGRRLSAATRKRILARDAHTCQATGETTGKMQIDHVVPWYWGGRDDDENLETKLAVLNQWKRERPLTNHELALRWESLGNTVVRWPTHQEDMAQRELFARHCERPLTDYEYDLSRPGGFQAR